MTNVETKQSTFARTDGGGIIVKILIEKNINVDLVDGQRRIYV